MRRLLLSMVLLISLAMGSGCFLPIYSGDPARRTKQLIYTSEDLRNFVEEWERFWFIDQPGHLLVAALCVWCLVLPKGTLASLRQMFPAPLLRGSLFLNR